MKQETLLLATMTVLERDRHIKKVVDGQISPNKELSPSSQLARIRQVAPTPDTRTEVDQVLEIQQLPELKLKE